MGFSGYQLTGDLHNRMYIACGCEGKGSEISVIVAFFITKKLTLSCNEFLTSIK